jgi:hypothetical protein
MILILANVKQDMKSNDTVKEFSCLPFLDNSSPETKGLNSYPA